MRITPLLSQRTANISASSIREILKVVSKPGMVSLAGGIPAPDSFPLKEIPALVQAVLDKYHASALQYDLTEGFRPLRQAITDRLLSPKGVQAQADDIHISSGSQGALDAIGKVLISKGDAIAVEAPTYLGALQAFDPYEPKYITLETDDQGLVPDSLEQAVLRHRIKFVYLVPTFQNPTGRTFPAERRQAIARLIERHDLLLIEDDPYCDLRYEEKHLSPIQVLAPEHVVYIGTLSKIFAPGLRIGYYLAPPNLRQWLVVVKQGVDLHTSTFNQAIAAEYLLGGHLEKHLPEILRLYKPRRDAILHALRHYFPADFRWSKPEGGMFVWAEGPPGFDAEELYRRSVANGVAFVPGRYFYAGRRQGRETLRLNFTMADEKTIDRCIAVISAAIPKTRS